MLSLLSDQTNNHDMEGQKKQSDRKEFYAFVDAIEARVVAIGTEKRATGRGADATIEKLFAASKGDASKITDEMIYAAFGGEPRN